MKLDDRLNQAHFPANPGDGFAARVLAATHSQPRLRRPSVLPEFLDGLGWAAAVWVGGFLLTKFFPALF